MKMGPWMLRGRSAVSLAQWLDDWRWALNMIRARRHRREMLFSQRIKFDAALRHITKGGMVVAYPDTIYSTTVDDVIRAYGVAHARD